MNDFKIIEVISEDGFKAVTLKGTYSSEIVRILEQLQFQQLNFVGIELPDFKDFSVIASKVQKLSLVAIEGKSFGLEAFSEIRELNLDEPIKPAFDISCFSKLVKAALTWNKNYPESFFNLPKLKKLKLRYFDESDCNMIRQSRSIEELSLLQSGLKSLAGLENIISLNMLTLAHNRKLVDIEALSEATGIKSIHIESCPQIKDLSPITELKNAERIQLENLKANFDNLDWIEKIPNLKFVLNEAEVENIDWEPVFKNKSLKEFATTTHQNYVITDDELLEQAAKFGRVIAKIERFPPKKKPMISLEFAV